MLIIFLSEGRGERKRKEAMKWQQPAARNVFLNKLKTVIPPCPLPKTVTLMYLPGEYPQRFASHAYSELCLEALG